jgi:uncharacterized SAM-binding protein YcdF (DUF218 family)
MKSLVALLLPNLALWSVLVLGVWLAFRPGRRRLALPILALAFLSLPLGPRLAGQAWTPALGMPEAVEGLAVLAPGAGITGPDALGRYWPQNSGVSRTMVAAGLAERHGMSLILSGGRTKAGAPSEASAMAALLNGKGPRIILEESARTTCETAQALGPILAREGLDGVVLVSDGLHLRRTRACLTAHGIAVRGLVRANPAPRPPGLLHLIPTVRALNDWGAGGYEAAASAYYVARGWIRPGDLFGD